MARRWAIGLIVTGAAVLVLTAGVSVGHGDPVPGTALPFDASFVDVWGFTIQVTAERQSLITDVIGWVSIAGLVAVVVGSGLLVLSLLMRLRSQRVASQVGHGTDRTDDP